MSRRALKGFMLSTVMMFAVAGCSESVDSLIASGDAAIAKGDYRTAIIQLKSALQQEPGNPRARWLLSEIYLITEQGAPAEKEIRRAGNSGIGDDAVLPALAHALLLQKKYDDILALPAPASLSARSRAEIGAAKGLAQLAGDDKALADELTRDALVLAPEAKLVIMARARVLADAGMLDDAEQLINNLQQTYPEYGPSWSLLGEIQTARGDLEKAEQAYTTAIEKRPVPHGDLLNRGQLRLRQRNLDGALADAEKLTKAVPNLQTAWYVAGAAHFLGGNFDKAQESLSRSYELNASHYPTIVMLGWANLELDSLNQAIRLAERAMSVAPGAIASRLLMTSVQLRQGEPEDAEKTIRPVVTALPENAHAKRLLIASLQAQGRNDEAAPLLVEVAAANPDSPDLQVAVGLELVRARESEEALVVLDELAARMPADKRVIEARVSALVQAGKRDQALAEAQRLHEQDPGDLVGLRTLGVAQAAKGDLDTAIGTFRKALETAPGDPETSMMLGRLLRLKGDLSAATTVVAKAAAMHPGNVDLAASAAALRVQQGRGDEALALLRKAHQQEPTHRPTLLLLSQQLLARNDAAGALSVLPKEGVENDPVLLLLRGDAHLRNGDATTARKDLEQVIRLAPDSAQAYYKLGLAHAALGETARRDEALDKAAELDPKHVGIGLARAMSLADRGQPEKAQALIGSFGLPESDPRRLVAELRIAEVAGDQTERVRLAQRLYASRPTAQYALGLARAQHANGDVDSAEATLKDWLKKHPEDDQVNMQLAALYGRTDRVAEAVVILRSLANKYPKNAAVLNNLAWYLRESTPGEALEFAQRAVAVAPENPEILSTYTSILMLDGQYEQALKTIDTAISRAPGNIQYKLTRIEILGKLGDIEKANDELDALEASGIPAGIEGQLEVLRQQIVSG